MSGKGQATRECLPFVRVIGVDPSAKMLEEARKVPKPTELKGELEYVQSGAEKLPFLKDGSVDLIVSGTSWQCAAFLPCFTYLGSFTAAQAAHWFDWNLLWQEAARVLSPGGTLAAWVRHDQSIVSKSPCSDILFVTGLLGIPADRLSFRHRFDQPVRARNGSSSLYRTILGTTRSYYPR